MASYDGESSSDEELDVRTNVTLGYATDDITGDEISHAGGHPTWLDAQTQPPASFVKCKTCNSNMSLLLQLHADLQQHFPEDQRRLFIWYCKKKQCSRKPGSVRAFREVKKAKTIRKSKPAEPAPDKKASQTPVNLGSQLFGSSPASPSSNVNPFSTSSTTSTGANPFSTTSSLFNPSSMSDALAAKPPQPPTQTFAEKLKISSSPPTSPKPEEPAADPWPPESAFPPPFPSFYLDAEAEYLEPTSSPAAGPSTSRITELDDEPATSSAVEKDLYESPHDKTFEHFTRILAQNPEQILRYEFRGTPLLYSSTDRIAPHFVLPGQSLRGGGNAKVKTSGPVKGIPGCQSCGAARVFEMQLVPYLIYELEKDNEEAMKLDGGEGMEWGTIIVGTCSKNCGDDESGRIVFREEWVGVQWEEGGTELKQKK